MGGDEELTAEEIEEMSIEELNLQRFSNREIAILTFKKVCKLDERMNKAESVTAPIRKVFGSAADSVIYGLGLLLVALIGFIGFALSKVLGIAKVFS